MADGLLLAWALGIWGYLAGLGVHIQQVRRFSRYLPYARDRRTVQTWIFDETNRAIVKALLAVWGIARLALIAERGPGVGDLPAVLRLDLLTLALYWGLLLVFTHWTWRVRRQRPEGT